jgi:hypothetical protein
MSLFIIDKTVFFEAQINQSNFRTYTQLMLIIAATTFILARVL